MSPFFFEVLAKVSIILIIGLAIASCMRAAAPSLRHLVLVATIASSLALPIAMALSPRWDLPLLPAGTTASLNAPVATQRVAAASAQTPGVTPSSYSSAAAVENSGPLGIEHPSREPSFSAAASPRWLALLWMLGFAAVIGWLVVGRIRLHRIGRMSWRLSSDDWTRVLSDETQHAGVDKTVQLCSSPVVSTPLTWGWRSPIILLPEDASDWAEDHRRIVLRHELAHIARGDALSQLLAGFVCALYWFHPLVWVAERRLRAECERACDDKVVSQGTPAAEYAAHLLEVARSARAFGAPGFLSVAMARPSQLEGRLLAVLNSTRRRVSLSRAARPVAAMLSLSLLLPLAALRAIPKPAVVMEKTPQASIDLPAKLEAKEATTLIATPAPTPAPREIGARADSTFALSTPVRSGGTLELDLRTGGSVDISGSDKSEVSVRASLAGRDWRNTQVQLVPTGNGARLESEIRAASNSQSTHHNFEISVPRNFNVKLRSAGGSVSIENVTGNFTGSTGGGEINIRRASGEVDLRTGGGDIDVAESKLVGTVSTGGGLVRLVGVGGNLKGYSGSGPVIYTNSASEANAVSVSTSGKHKSTISSSTKDNSSPQYVVDGVRVLGNSNDASSQSVTTSSGITMTSSGGPISVPSAPGGANVSTGGGRVRIGPSGGKVYAQTGGGDIDVGPASGSVEAHTGAGDVEIELKGADSHVVGVTSGTGNVSLVLPPNVNATLELETAYTDTFGRKTRIISDWPVTSTETSNWDDSHGSPRRYVRVRQNLGRGGAVIRVRTVNGDITLRRGS